MKYSILTFVCLTVITISGCQTLSQQGQVVKFTKDDADVIGCQKIGEVLAPPPFVGPLDAEYMLRNKAAELGATAVLVTKMNIGTAKGDAYRCS